MRLKTFAKFSQVQESLGTGVETFKDKLDKTDIDLYNFPESEGDEEILSADVEYQTELSVKNAGIDDIYFTIKRIVLNLRASKDGGDVYDDLPPIEIIPTPDQVKVETLKLPFYLTKLEIDMKDGMDTKLFTIEASFGADKD